VSGVLTKLRQRCQRNPAEAWLGGVCAGLARTFGTDPALVRAAVILAAIFATKMTVGLYLVAWLLLEER
jgi:phage shock protein C